MTTDALARQVDALPADLRSLVDRVANQVDAFDWPPLSEVYLTGAGDSHHASVATELAFESYAGLACEPMGVHRFTEYGSPAMRLRPGKPLVVLVSASGRSPRILAAAHRARDCGATTLAVTSADSPLAAATDRQVRVDVGMTERSPGVRTYQASLVGLTLLAAGLGGVLGAVAEELMTAAPIIERSADALRSAADAAADCVAAAPAVVVLGSGPHYGTAMFGAAKLVEAGGFPASAQDIEEWWHIERRVQPSTMPVLVVAPPDRSHARAVAAGAAARQLGRPVMIVAAVDDRDAAAQADLVLPVNGRLSEELNPFTYHVFSAYLAAATTTRLGRQVFPSGPPGQPSSLDAFIGAATER